MKKLITPTTVYIVLGIIALIILTRFLQNFSLLELVTGIDV